MLSKREKFLTTLHELTHASLHPPGCDDFNEAEYRKEESCSHQATDEICVGYGVRDYGTVMIRLGVPNESLRGDDKETVEVMVERVRLALDASNECPFWAEPISDKFLWRQAKNDTIHRLRNKRASCLPRKADLWRIIYAELLEQSH